MSTSRQLHEADVEIFKQLRLESLSDSPAAYASSYADWVDLPRAAWVKRLTEDVVFASFNGPDPFGLMGTLRQRPSKMAHRASIVMVYLRASHRGQGLAATLLRAVENHARTAGILQLELSVASTNLTAIGFYTHMGYRKTGEIPSEYLHQGTPIDGWQMVRVLDT